MSVHRQELQQYIDRLLPSVSDYCPNGLQVQGAATVQRIVTAVTASLACIEQAAQANADVLLVHHGIFWKGDAPELVGMKYQRVKLLIENNINLMAYHLPLDLHQEWGNNVQLAKQMGVAVTEFFDCVGINNLACMAHLAQPVTADQWQQHLEDVLRRPVLLEPAGPGEIKRLAWCTGAAQDGIHQAAERGADAYITGEASERTVHEARELGVHLYVAGHHATERYGVQALGTHCAEKFGLVHQFIDIDNPI